MHVSCTAKQRALPVSSRRRVSSLSNEHVHIVVPNSKLAYLARLAFGEGDYRVFYNDMVTAIQWLAEE